MGALLAVPQVFLLKPAQAGGKGKLLDRLQPLFPPKFNRYIEPFAGGVPSAVSFGVPVAGREVLNARAMPVENVNTIIADEIVGMEVTDQVAKAPLQSGLWVPPVWCSLHRGTSVLGCPVVGVGGYPIGDRRIGGQIGFARIALSCHEGLDNGQGCRHRADGAIDGSLSNQAH